jgi:putative SOS response-associated peptidase YedK
VFPDYPAPVVRNTDTGRELSMMRWGPPPKSPWPPVTNIRNTSSPHWRGWLKPENRCLVPFNSFAEYAPEQLGFCAYVRQCFMHLDEAYKTWDALNTDADETIQFC